MEQRLKEAEQEFEQARLAYEKAEREMREKKRTYDHIKGEALRSGSTEEQKKSWERFRQIVARAKFLYNHSQDRSTETWRQCMQSASNEMDEYGIERFVEVFKGLMITDE